MSEDSTSDKPKDDWSSGDRYEPYVGRWSRLVAREFLAWLAVPTGRDWLDVGCGTGAISQTILQAANPTRIKGVDRSEEYVSFARMYTPDSRAAFEVGDAQALNIQAGTYHAVVSGLVLNFLPRPDRALAEMVRVTRPGGVVAIYVWDYAGRMQFMRHFWDAAAALDPSALDLDEGRRFPICQPGPLRELFEAVGLREVKDSPIEITTVFQDLDDYWSPFLGGQGPAPSYTMSLSEERRAALRERIQAGLPFAPNGSIPLVARAWAVKGIR